MKRSHSSIIAVPSPLGVTQLVPLSPSVTPPSSTSLTSSTAVTTKRMDHLSWDDYFMWNAQLASLRSKDPSTQVGACIVDTDQHIVSIGYNGFPRDCSDDVLPWARTTESGDPLETKYREFSANFFFFYLLSILCPHTLTQYSLPSPSPYLIICSLCRACRSECYIK